MFPKVLYSYIVMIIYVTYPTVLHNIVYVINGINLSNNTVMCVGNPNTKN